MQDKPPLPRTITAADLRDGIGSALLGMIASTTTAGTWLSYPLRADADATDPPRVTDAGCIITRASVDQCARAQGVRLAAADVDAVLGLAALALNSAAAAAVVRIVAQIADPARDDGAARAVVDALGEMGRDWLRETEPMRAAARELERLAAQADPAAGEQMESLHAWRSTRSGSALAGALTDHGAARAALAAAQVADEEAAREAARIVARWSEIARAELNAQEGSDE